MSLAILFYSESYKTHDGRSSDGIRGRMFCLRIRVDIALTCQRDRRRRSIPPFNAESHLTGLLMRHTQDPRHINTNHRTSSTAAKSFCIPAPTRRDVYERTSISIPLRRISGTTVCLASAYRWCAARVLSNKLKSVVVPVLSSTGSVGIPGYPGSEMGEGPADGVNSRGYGWSALSGSVGIHGSARGVLLGS